MTKRLLLLSAILLYIAPSVLAQNIHVLNDHNEFPIPGVILYNEDRTVSGQTDGHGSFDISVFADTDSIIFRHTAFIQEIFSKEDLESMSYEIYLLPNDMLIGEIDIVGSNDRENRQS